MSVFRLFAYLVVVGWVLGPSQVRADSSCIIPSAAAKSSPSRAELVGHYQAVSESEWSLELWLRPNLSAELLAESWNAGEHEKRTGRRYKGSWAVVNGFIELRYRGICETLEFSSKLSLSELGAEGSAPGVRGLHSSVSQNLFIGTSLWRASSLKEQFPQE